MRFQIMSFRTDSFRNIIFDGNSTPNNGSSSCSRYWIYVLFDLSPNHRSSSVIICHIATNQKGQRIRIPQWIFPQKVDIQQETYCAVNHRQSGHALRRRALYQLLTVDCKSRVSPQDKEWVVTFRNVEDAQIRAAILFFMTYDSLNKTCCRFRPLSMSSNSHSLISLHSEIESDHIDRTYLKLLDAHSFGKRQRHPRPQTARIRIEVDSRFIDETEITEIASSAYYEVRS